MKRAAALAVALIPSMAFAHAPKACLTEPVSAQLVRSYVEADERVVAWREERERLVREAERLNREVNMCRGDRRSQQRTVEACERTP